MLLVALLGAQSSAQAQEQTAPPPPGSLQIPVPDPPRRPAQGSQQPQLPEAPPGVHEATFDARCRSNPEAWRDSDPRTRKAPHSRGGGLTQPPYPPLARRLLQEGTVTLLLLVNEDGAVVQGIVERSAGFRALDQAALDTSGTWKFNPGMLGDKPFCMWGRFAVTFKLTDEMLEEGDRLVHAEARKLAELLVTDDVVISWFSQAPLLRGSDAATRLLPEVAPLVIEPIVMREVQDAYAATLSKTFSAEQLATVLAFFETPAGRQWRDVEAQGAREAWGKVWSRMGRYTCSVFMAQRALEARKAPAPAKAEDSRKALPGIIAEHQEFCDCASQYFREGIGAMDAAAREQPLKQALAAKCELPEVTK